MDASDYGEYSQITLEQFIDKSSQLQVKVIGTIKTIFKHKQYIIEIFLNRNAVIRCYKRYNQFQALHELIQMKYKNYKIKQLPSKFQLFNKEETRKNYFQNILTQIIKDHSKEGHSDTMHETSRRLLSILYLFLTSNIEDQKAKKLRKQEKKNQNLTETSMTERDSNLKTLYVFNYNQTRSEIGVRPKPALEMKFLREKNSDKIRKMSLNFDEENKKKIRPRCNSLEKQYVSVIMKDTKGAQSNQFEVKFSHESVWRKRYIQIKDSGLFLYVNKLDNYFRTHIELYRITAQFQKRDMNIIDHFCQKMEFDLTRTFNQNPRVLSLYHEHDCDKILIRKPMKTGEDPQYNINVLQKLKNSIVEASENSPIFPDFEGVFNPIGKLFLFMHKIYFNWKKHTDAETIRIRIKTGAMTYESRPIVYTHQILINQGFLIPISNTFETVKIECYSIKDEGWVNNESNMGKIMGTFSFNMAEFLTKPKRYLVSKFVAKLDTTQQSKAQKYETKLQLSIENYSAFSSIYSDSFSNQHDGVPLRQFQGLDDLTDVSITVDRVLRILGNIALLIQAFWRNVYLFKYPRMGYFFFFLVLFNALFFDVGDIVREFVAFALGAVLYQEKHVNLVVKFLMNKYLFSKMHPNFKKPLMLSTGEVKYLKWSNQMKYIAEDYEMKDGRLIKKTDKKRTVYEFVVHERVFLVTEDEQSFFEKMKEAKKIIELVHKMINSVVCALEKLGNLLSWMDYKRTIFLVSLLLILTGIASGSLVRVLISLFCVHRFYKGLFFFQEKHYARNRMFAVYCLRYILQKSFPAVIGDRNNHKDLKLEELDKFLSELVFPIHDVDAQKVLKFEMDQIMGVYFDPEALFPRSIKKNYLKVSHLIDFVESCQSRLKLKWIAGAEGISNEFQQLKQETKEIPIIDIWLQNALINFIMNTPSQLFMAFHRDRLHRKKKTETTRLNQTFPESGIMNNSMLTMEDFEFQDLQFLNKTVSVQEFEHSSPSQVSFKKNKSSVGSAEMESGIKKQLTKFIIKKAFGS